MKDSSLILTGDGSHSIFSEHFDVPYHSVHGSITETQHVFIEAGLKNKLETKKNNINLLEIGLGTGLNAFMSLLYADQHNINLQYTSLEAYPIREDQFAQLNFAEILDTNYSPHLQLIHQCEWNKPIALSPNFTFKKVLIDFLEYDYPQKFDLIYFDAFAPTSQPELWEAPFLKKMYNCLSLDGILTTYCAKGSFKRALKEVGFKVEALPGPPRKREMTRGRKC